MVPAATPPRCGGASRYRVRVTSTGLDQRTLDSCLADARAAMTAYDDALAWLEAEPSVVPSAATSTGIATRPVWSLTMRQVTTSKQAHQVIASGI